MRVLLLALVCVLLASCGQRRDPYGTLPRVGERRMRNLEALAARDMNCPAVAIAISQISDRIYLASGCNVLREYAIMARGRGRYQSARWRGLVPIDERAATEMQCPVAAIAITATQPMERVATGCGRTATFGIECGHIDCAWMITSQAGAPPQTDTVIVVPDTGASQLGAPQ